MSEPIYTASHLLSSRVDNHCRKRTAAEDSVYYRKTAAVIIQHHTCTSPVHFFKALYYLSSRYLWSWVMCTTEGDTEWMRINAALEFASLYLLTVFSLGSTQKA